MKNVVLIASRLNVLEHMKDFSELHVVRLFVQEDSLLHKRMSETGLPKADVRVFNLHEKTAVIDEIKGLDFDLLISNGCPFILPVDTMRRASQLFINIHPTLLPELKGKTPLSGVFITHQKAIGATMHYIDEGIDTGAIIAQQKVDLTNDIDQGLVYKISFDLEAVVFIKGMENLRKSNFRLKGTVQGSKGSYFNRTTELQCIDIENDTTNSIIDKIRSFGIKGQGSNLTIGGMAYVIYSAEKIINEYLLITYHAIKTGNVVFEYDEKIILRTRDGMVKLTNYEIQE